MISFKQPVKLLVLSCLMVSATFAAKPLSDAQNLIKSIINVHPAMATELGGKDIHSFSDEELLAIVQTMNTEYADSLTEDTTKKLVNANELLATALKEYKATGSSFCIDPNGTCVVGNQDPRFVVTFKNTAGQLKQRTFQASIDLVGINIELGIRLNLISFVGTPLNFYDSFKPIELGMGVEIAPAKIYRLILFLYEKFIGRSLRQEYHARAQARIQAGEEQALVDIQEGHRMQEDLNAREAAIERFRLPTIAYIIEPIDPIFMYVPFKNIAGGMIILGARASILGGPLALVTGGTLTPVMN